MSLAVAASLWLYVSSVESRVDFFPGAIALEPKNIASDLAVIYDNDSVKIKVSASASAWGQMTQEDFVANVDLEKLSLGTHDVPIEVSSALPGVQVVDVQPDKIRVRIEPAVTTSLNVSARFEGELAPGYEILQTKIEPDKVEVKGAQDVINSLVTATAVVKLAGEDRDIKRKINLAAFDEFDKPIRGMVFTPEKVDVAVSVTRQGGGKVVGIKPDISGKPALGFWINKIDYEPSLLRVVGSEDVLKNIEYIQTQKLDIGDLKSTKDFDVGFALPAGVALESGQPEKIKITVGIASNSISREVIAGVSYTSLGNGLRVSQIAPAEIRVVVTGSPGALNNLTAQNVVANIDVSGKGSGSHLVGLTPGRISAPAGINISSVVPSNVTITIEEIQ